MFEIPMDMCCSIMREKRGEILDDSCTVLFQKYRQRFRDLSQDSYIRLFGMTSKLYFKLQFTSTNP